MEITIILNESNMKGALTSAIKSEEAYLILFPGLNDKQNELIKSFREAFKNIRNYAEEKQQKKYEYLGKYLKLYNDFLDKEGLKKGNYNIIMSPGIHFCNVEKEEPMKTEFALGTFAKELAVFCIKKMEALEIK